VKGIGAAAPVGLPAKIVRGGLAALLAALLAGAIAAALLPHPAGAPHTHAHDLFTAASSQHATPLPAGLLAAASATIGRGEPRFWPRAHDGALQLHDGAIHGSFTVAGARLRIARSTLALRLTGIGRGQRLLPLSATAPRASANEVRYRHRSIGGHGSLSEYYGSGPYGLEQSFTIARRPQGSGELMLAIHAGGSLTPRQTGSEVVFDTPRGIPALSYGQLSAVDVDGRRLPSKIVLDGTGLQLQIDDAHARYPLRIDPFIRQGLKLTGGAEQGAEAARFGASVALSAAGEIALVGAPDYDGSGGATHYDTGRAWVFARSGSSWEQQGPALRGAELKEEHIAEFGASVALSASGYTALIGAPARANNGGEKIGDAWVFVRKGSSWSQQGKALIGTAMRGRSLFGSSVSLSADGDTALIGGEGDLGAGEYKNAGAAWVFTRSGSTWAQDGEKLTGGGETNLARFGHAVVLSADGNTALIGGPYDGNANAGAVWVFARSGSTWTQDGEKITDKSVVWPEHDEYFGWALALAGETNVALVASRFVLPGMRSLAAGTVLTRTESGWVQQGPKLLGLDQEQLNTYGARGVALSANGETALISAPNTQAGAWVFTRSGSTWTQQGESLAGPSNSVALSSWGTALVGSGGEEGGKGAAFAFGRAQPGCTDSWTNAAGGSWFTGSNWSMGVPPGSEDEACITAPGTYTVSMGQTESTGTVSVRSLMIGAGSGAQTLVVAGSCSQNAVLSASREIVDGWHGTIELTNGDSCASDVTVKGPVANQGLLAAEEVNGGTRTVQGDLTNNGTVSLAAGQELHVGGFQQTSLGRLKTSIAGASDYGSLIVEHGLVLGGGLVVQQVPPFKATSSDSFQLIPKTGWLVGGFQTLSGMQIGYTPDAYYKLEYFQKEKGQTHIVLAYGALSAKLSPTGGTPGSSVTVTGGGFLAGETITPTFTDHEGVVTTYPSLTASSHGTFSTSIAIPAGAAPGQGKVTVTGSYTGVRIGRPFEVT
jgi:hypothetical protein